MWLVAFCSSVFKYSCARDINNAVGHSDHAPGRLAPTNDHEEGPKFPRAKNLRARRGAVDRASGRRRAAPRNDKRNATIGTLHEQPVVGLSPTARASSNDSFWHPVQ